MCECNHVLCVGEGGRDGGRTRGVPGLGELHVLSQLYPWAPLQWCLSSMPSSSILATILPPRTRKL